MMYRWATDVHSCCAIPMVTRPIRRFSSYVRDATFSKRSTAGRLDRVVVAATDRCACGALPQDSQSRLADPGRVRSHRPGTAIFHLRSIESNELEDSSGAVGERLPSELDGSSVGRLRGRGNRTIEACINALQLV